jgi:hypothetical protein
VLTLNNACKKETPKPEFKKHNVEIPLIQQDLWEASFEGTMQRARDSLAHPQIDTVFHALQNDWEGMSAQGARMLTNRIYELYEIDANGRIQFKGKVNPEETTKTDSTRLAILGIIVDAKLVHNQ